MMLKEERMDTFQLMCIGMKCLGRDDAWKAQTIANTSEQQFKVEFECEFLGSVNTLIAPSKLKKFNL